MEFLTTTIGQKKSQWVEQGTADNDDGCEIVTNLLLLVVVAVVEADRHLVGFGFYYTMKKWFGCG